MNSQKGLKLILLILLCVISGAANCRSEPPVVLITGSNRGIGLEFTRQYAERGWQVIATCRRPEAATELQAIARNHSNVIIEALDITDHAAVDRLAEHYAQRPIDVLLNNAAYLGSRQPPPRQLERPDPGLEIGAAGSESASGSSQSINKKQRVD